MSKRKIFKLAWQIKKKEREIRQIEDRIDRARVLLEDGELSKAEYTKIKMDLAAKIRGIRSTIKRKRLARMRIEQKMKEKREEKEKKRAERERRREKKRLEKEKKLREKAGRKKKKK
jgi:hypothetical protein